MKKISFFPFFFIFLFLFLVKTQNGKAATCPPAPSTPSCDFCSSYVQTQYRCNSQCPNAKIEKREKTCWSGKTCSPQEIKDENGCVVSWKCVNCTSCASCEEWSSPQKIEDCQAWQDCGSSEWSWSKNVCKCAGPCLETPKNQRYYDNPNYSDKPDKDVGNVNIKLPVKLDWDDVQYWQASPDGPRSYVIRIGNTTNDPFSSTIKKSEFIPNSCLLKSNATHNWYVKACCTDGGGDCGSESNWPIFSTSLAPEPVSPLDPDWEGSQGANNVSIPVDFDWCDVNNTQSYVIQIYKDGILRHVDGVAKINGTLPSEIEIDGLEVFTGKTTYEWEMATCFNKNATKCGASCGENELVTDCADFSQRWNFTTADVGITPPQLLKPFYNPAKPEEIPTVNLDSILEWTRTEYEGRWARSYFFEIKEDTTIVVSPTLTTSYIVPFETVWSSLSFNTTYNWHVKSCYGEGGTDCSDFGETWYFKTTGAKPTTLNTDSTIIPVKLDWNDIAGAASYKYEVSSDSSFSSDKIVASGVVGVSEASVDSPNLVQDTDYWWRVRTCADKAGAICGDWSNSQNFKTFKLGVPSNPSPQNGGQLFTYEKYISWDPVLGAKFYQYKIDYISRATEETSDTCPQVGSEVIKKIISSNSGFLSLECLGGYQWSVRACLDKDCNAVGNWSNVWQFTLVQPSPPATGGLVPCGRDYDVPETPWNEREKCGIQHIFIMFKNILDFLLWRVAPIMLVLLTILTGIIFYFSMGAPTTIVNVKSIWKSAGMGYGVIFLAWTIINMLLKILGITTKWWILPF